ncbi:MAG: magnesium transporter, partial [Fimbriiglobus sp.]|jgi:magnesium transporter|nr:magnesium transporter [Fimbriiglobus sp.]
MPHPLYTPEIREMLAEDDSVGLGALCAELHPATIATAIDDFDSDLTWKLLSGSDVRTQAAIFEYLPSTMQVELLDDPSRPQVVKLIEKMSHDDRVDLLKKLPTRVYENLLRLVDEADRRDMKALFEYGEGTVGAIMTTDYAWLPPTLTAAEAVDQLRAQAPDKETIYYIYVLGDARKRADGGISPRPLQGIISLRDLILAPRHVLISELMEGELVALKFTDPQAAAADILGRYDFIAVPVLDEHGGMLGIVTHDDALDVVTQEATEDLQKQGGVSPIAGDYLNAGLWQVWKSRVGWLAGLFIAQLLTVIVMSFYEDQLKKVTILATLIPLCLSVGGNAGSQASTLVTRALALDQVRVGDWVRVFRRELVVGSALALTLGVLGLFRTYFLTFHEIAQSQELLLKLTAVIGISVLFICLWGTLLGSMLPIVIKKLGFDPALMSSPFIATLSDVSGIVIYFSVAWLFFFAGGDAPEPPPS